MENRIDRYFKGEPLYAYGFGLSYTTFKYSNLTVPKSVSTGDTFQVAVDVKNTGTLAGEEVVQLYVSDVESYFPVPIQSIQGFERISLEAGQSKTLYFTLTPLQLSLVDNDNQRVVEPGLFKISIGGCKPNIIGSATKKVLSTYIELTGNYVILD